MYWGGRQRPEVDGGVSKRGVRSQTEGKLGARGAWRGPTSRFDGSVQRSHIVQDFSRPSDKPGITVFMRRGAHVYTINAVFTPYLKLVAR